MKIENFRKSQLFFDQQSDRKKSDFFEIFLFSIFDKKKFIEKMKISRHFYVFLFLPYLMYNFCEWHRATPTVRPVGAVNVSRKSEKSRNFINFPDFPSFFQLRNVGFVQLLSRFAEFSKFLGLCAIKWSYLRAEEELVGHMVHVA